MRTLHVDRPSTAWWPVALAVIAAAALAPSPAHAQALAPTITKSFAPSTVTLNGQSIATITVTNPNQIPLTNVQFSDTMPAGITLVTQTGGTCSTLATGGGMFSINPGAGTFASTSSVLAGGQSCNITVQVLGNAVGVPVNTTSQVTATGAPAGGPATATLTVFAVVPTLPAWMLLVLAAGLAAASYQAFRSRRVPGDTR